MLSNGSLLAHKHVVYCYCKYDRVAPLCSWLVSVLAFSSAAAVVHVSGRLGNCLTLDERRLSVKL